MAVVLSRKSGGGSSGGAPTGPAGGDLTGTYPNPTIGAGKVTAAQVAADVATQAELDAVATASVAKAIVDAKGDLIVATAADTVARKAVGATNGMHLEAQSGQSDGLLWALPPGYEFAYAGNTSSVTVSATTEGTANTIATAGAVVFDGSTTVLIEGFAYSISAGSNAGGSTTYVILRESTTAVAYLGAVTASVSATAAAPFRGAFRLTPSAASHTYNIAAYRDNANGVISAAANGPSFIRITKV